MSMGNAVVNAIRVVDSRVYTPGTTAQLLYIASGRFFQAKKDEIFLILISIFFSFTDWAYEIFQTNYSQTIELRDTGRYGFYLSSCSITWSPSRGPVF